MIKATVYLAMSPAERLAYRAKQGLVTLCGVCDKPVTAQDKQDPQGPQFIKKGKKTLQVHVSCYFDSFGDALEKHPIIPRRVRRRT